MNEHASGRLKTDVVQNVCEICGKPKSISVGHHEICLECYVASSSTDHELGGDDYWQQKEALQRGD